MRFSCGHCGKRYVTADAFQPGRLYRVKCKACGGVIIVRGAADVAGSATGETPAVPVAPPASVPSTAPSRPAMPAAPRPPPPPGEPKYIDLFEGEDVNAPAPTPAPGLARRKGSVGPSLTEPAPPRIPPATPPAPPPVRLVPEPDPFVSEPDALVPEPDPLASELGPFAAATRAPALQPEPSRSPPPRQATTAHAPEPDRESPRPPAAPPSLRRMPLAIGLAAAAGVVLVLLALVIGRPRMPASTGRPSQPEPRNEELHPAATSAVPSAPAPAPGQPTGAAAAATTPPTAPASAAASAQPAPAAVAPAPAPTASADDRAARPARLEREKRLAEKLERERRAREERELLKAEKAEKERARRARLEQAKNVTAEPAAPARTAHLTVTPSPAQAPRSPLPAAPGLPPEAVEKALASGRRSLEACFRDVARGIAPPIEARQVTVHLFVQPDGAVTSPEVDDQNVAATPAGQCLKTAATGLQFPAFQGEPARITAPVSVPPAPPGGRLIAVEFTGVRSSRGGGEVNDTVYSEKANDAKITEKSFADGIVTFAGQVGFGEDSKYAGIGLNVDMLPGGKAIDASRFASMTVKLAGDGVRTVRIRLIGAESDTRGNGCYPIAQQRVSEDVKEYVLRFSQFEPESWCGGKGRSAPTTLKGLVGFEIADVDIDRKPVRVSVGSIVLNP